MDCTIIYIPELALKSSQHDTSQLTKHMPNPKLLKRTETTSSDTRDLITTSPSPSNTVSPKDVVNALNFGFLPIPSRLRYEPGKPFSFGLPLNLFFGSINGLTVASLYYCQPLLVQMAKSFNLSEEQVTLIPTLTQAGYATGLVFISPLGDLVRRRELLLMLGCLVGIFNLGLALSPTGKIFAGISYLMGIVTVVPPVIISLTGDLAPPERRASAIAISVTGALIGILYARVVAGIVAEFVSWRIIYWISCGMQFSSVLTMWMVIPDYPSKNPHSTYTGILYTMARYAVTEPGLIQCYLISMISSAIFANFWVNLTFLLTGTPYGFST
ncbi:major facilitator superfamily transporter [Ceratobasidium sp. AG-Ba]|nr:major facilitator superfamily transporter [Ceratobasidium sp. AG-Ba]